MNKVTQITVKQKPHDGAINRAAFALGMQAAAVRAVVEKELKTRNLGASHIGRWYVLELTKLGMNS